MKLKTKLWILINLIKYVFTSESCFYISMRRKHELTTNLIEGYKSDITQSLSNEMYNNKDVRLLILKAVSMYEELKEQENE